MYSKHPATYFGVPKDSSKGEESVSSTVPWGMCSTETGRMRGRLNRGKSQQLNAVEEPFRKSSDHLSLKGHKWGPVVSKYEYLWSALTFSNIYNLVIAI